jgi:small-conductance mechanosensitive channel
MENSYAVGDEIQISGTTGRVVEMNLRTTIVVDEEGSHYTIPNSSISVIKKVSHKKDIEGGE